MKKLNNIAMIGTGIAGLAAAILRAHQDSHVTSFEKVDHLQTINAEGLF
ncbi:NAD(P)-binding protein [Acinetobacter sp. WU_MDCI_Axc73]|nr:NAD(P)-binding protein [Acinetobacter sp. WU_MDCI_Axc73]